MPSGLRSRSLQRATSCGRVRLSSVNWSSNNFEKETMSLVLACSPLLRIWEGGGAGERRRKVEGDNRKRVRGEGREGEGRRRDV